VPPVGLHGQVESTCDAALTPWRTATVAIGKAPGTFPHTRHAARGGAGSRPAHPVPGASTMPPKSGSISGDERGLARTRGRRPKFLVSAGCARNARLSKVSQTAATRLQLPAPPFFSEGLRPSDAPTPSLARRFAGSLRSGGSFAALTRFSTRTRDSSQRSTPALRPTATDARARDPPGDIDYHAGGLEGRVGCGCCAPLRHWHDRAASGRIPGAPVDPPDVPGPCRAAAWQADQIYGETTPGTTVDVTFSRARPYFTRNVTRLCSVLPPDAAVSSIE